MEQRLSAPMGSKTQPAPRHPQVPLQVARPRPPVSSLYQSLQPPASAAMAVTARMPLPVALRSLATARAQLTTVAAQEPLVCYFAYLMATAVPVCLTLHEPKSLRVHPFTCMALHSVLPIPDVKHCDSFTAKCSSSHPRAILGLLRLHSQCRSQVHRTGPHPSLLQ